MMQVPSQDGSRNRIEEGDEFVGVEIVDVDLVESELVDDGIIEVERISDVADQEPSVGEDESAVAYPPPASRGSYDDDDDNSDLEEVAFAKRELPKDDMDMTPMVDVTFLLLIFFMITASFSSEKVFEEPKALSDTPSTQVNEEPEKPKDLVRVQVDEFNGYTIILPGGTDTQASSKQDLMIALDDARKELVTGVNDDALKLIVEAHVDSIHSAVVAALDAGREKGFTSFQVNVVEEFD